MNLDAIFSPKSVAIVGASTRVGSVGNDIVKNLVTQGFRGKIYPVNPNATELYEKKCYRNIQEISSSVDLVIVAVPANGVLKVVQESIEKGVLAIIIISSGFREAGNIQKEEEIRNLCDKADVALLGPNCLGVIHPYSSMNASFATRIPKAGSIAFLSQSGALCTAILDYSAKTNFGFSKFVSMGNKAQIDEVALMRFLEEDAETKIVVLYVEQLTDADGFIEAVQRLHAKGKPVLVIKSGVTSVGAGASASHTGALAGDDAVYEALFEKAGAIRIYDFDDLFEYLSGFMSQRLPKGNRVAILTNAGGPGVLVTDEIILRNLQLANFSQETLKKLGDFLPASASMRNPVDILGDADASRYRRSLEILLEESSVDSVIVVLTPQSMTEISKTAEVIIDVSQSSEKVIYVVFMGATDVMKGIEILQKKYIPVSQFPQKAIRSLDAMYRFTRLSSYGKNEESSNTFEKNEKSWEIISRYSDGGNLSSSDALKFFEMYGFSIARSTTITDVSQAREAVESMGGVAVFKIISPDITHKSDVGGIALSVSSDTAEKEFETMIGRVLQKAPRAKIEGILVAEKITEKGFEFILGSTKDPNLGCAIMVGLGGIYVEVFRDVSFGLIPISEKDAIAMIEKLRSKVLLRGVRGNEILDEKALVRSIKKMSEILENHPEILETDINPLLVLAQGKGVKVLDARIYIRSQKTDAST